MEENDVKADQQIIFWILKMMGLTRTTAVLVIAFCCFVVVGYLILLLYHLLFGSYYTIASRSIYIILNCSDFPVCNISYIRRHTNDTI